jgi:hypothetical protein
MTIKTVGPGEKHKIVDANTNESQTSILMPYLINVNFVIVYSPVMVYPPADVIGISIPILSPSLYESSAGKKSESDFNLFNQICSST